MLSLTSKFLKQKIEFYQKRVAHEDKKDLGKLYNEFLKPLMSREFERKITHLFVKIERKDSTDSYFLGPVKKVFIEILNDYGREMKSGGALQDQIVVENIALMECGTQFFFRGWDNFNERLYKECYQLLYLFASTAIGLEFKI